MNRQKLILELERDEGVREHVYDDATGAPIRPGVMVRGHPTVGVGRALDVNPLDSVEINFLLNRTIDLTATALSQALPWFEALDDVRARAIVNLAFNLGVPQFLEWHRTIGFMAEKDYPAAADEIENSHPWIDQVGSRGHRIAAMIRTGNA